VRPLCSRMAHPHHHGPHDHAHDRHGHDHGAPRRLVLVLVLTAAFMVVEVVGGLLAGSLALLADAGHMFTDVGALALSLWAIRLARRPANAAKTYGYVRLEILAALVNGATLLVMSGFIAWEAWARLREPQPVDGPLLMAVAAAGLVVNLVGAWLLHAHAGESLNVRGAYLHVLGDLLGSVGALIAGVIVWGTGWAAADPIASVVIALLILGGAWRLVREAADILLEAAPAHVDVAALLADLRDVPELHDVHDLHVWTLTSGFVALSAHGVIEDPWHHRQVLDEIRARVRRHGIDHVTFQLEPRALVQVRKPGERGG
jgi:cobalt-zinc-cadmium efflux system protein